jgi:hypothetical protein
MKDCVIVKEFKSPLRRRIDLKQAGRPHPSIVEKFSLLK